MVDYLESLRPERTEGEALRVGPHGTSRQPFRRPGGGGATIKVKRYRLKVEGGDYLMCHSWDGTTEGTTDILVAKPDELRYSIPGETILGVAYIYYYSNSGNPLLQNASRTSHDTSGSSPDEVQMVSKPWVLNEVIYAINADTGVKDASGNPISKLMILPAKLWTEV